jgi:hypothetical protein
MKSFDRLNEAMNGLHHYRLDPEDKNQYLTPGKLLRPNWGGVMYASDSRAYAALRADQYGKADAEKKIVNGKWELHVYTQEFYDRLATPCTHFVLDSTGFEKTGSTRGYVSKTDAKILSMDHIRHEGSWAYELEKAGVTLVDNR